MNRRGFATHVLVGICGLVTARIVQSDETKLTLLANETGSIKPRDPYSIHVQNIPVSVELGRKVCEEDIERWRIGKTLDSRGLSNEIGDVFIYPREEDLEIYVREWYAYKIKCPD